MKKPVKKVEKSKEKKQVTLSQSMAVRYRPKIIEDLVGQSAIVTKFNGMLKTREFPSCFLVFGPSGTGKTTIGRMINRYLNCESLSACGECPSCKHDEVHPDFMEMNMANTRGIEDARNLIDAAKRMPRYSKRVFLLDEVHQLTSQAANAVLKILEEPPENTIWILATTNPEKVLPTIKGRCHPFEVRHLEERAIVKRLLYIAKQERQDFKNEEGIELLKTMASLCNGQMRDSIQLLESIIYAIRSGEQISQADLIKKYVTTLDADLDKLAAWTLVCLLSNDIRSLMRALVDNGNSRAIVRKLIYLIQDIFRDYTEKQKFMSYCYRFFRVKSEAKNIKIDEKAIQKLLKVQKVLAESELQMNQGMYEETALMSALGQFL